jgi:hypothetical protein
MTTPVHLDLSVSDSSLTTPPQPPLHKRGNGCWAWLLLETLWLITPWPPPVYLDLPVSDSSLTTPPTPPSQGGGTIAGLGYLLETLWLIAP